MKGFLSVYITSLLLSLGCLRMKVVNEVNVIERDKSDVSMLTGKRGEQSDKS